MSIIHPNAIKAIAHSVDIPKLSDEAAKTLAPDVEYRLREVVQEALKFAKHCKRTKLTTEDINDALRLRNVEPVFGFGSRDPAKFLRVATHPELMYVQDMELNYHQLIETPLPKLPRDATVAAHWLCINGVQPELPENTPIEQPPAKKPRLLGAATPKLQKAAIQEGQGPSAGADTHAAGMASGTAAQTASTTAAAGGRAVSTTVLHPKAAAVAALQLQLPVRHAVSRELQVYFDRIVGLLMTAPWSAATGAGSVGSAGQSASYLHQQHGDLLTAGNTGPSAAAAAAPRDGFGTAAAGAVAAERIEVQVRAALASVSADPGLHPLVPYFTAFVADAISKHLSDLWLLSRLLQLAAALLANPSLHLEPYLQQLLPAVMTCLVTKTLGLHAFDDHWSVRRQAAMLLATMAAQFQAPHHNLTPRLCRVLAEAFLDLGKPLTTKYGAVVGLQALGPQVVQTLLIPQLEPFMSTRLFPAMSSEDASSSNSSSGTDNTSKAAGDGSGKSQQHQQEAGASGSGNSISRRRQQQNQKQQLQLQHLEAWRVYGALLSAVGNAMYNLLIGHLQGQLPLSLLLARHGKQQVDWETEYAQTLLAVKRSSTAHLAIKAAGQKGDLQLQVAGTDSKLQKVKGEGSSAGQQGANGVAFEAPAPAAAATGALAEGANASFAEHSTAGGEALQPNRSSSSVQARPEQQLASTAAIAANSKVADRKSPSVAEMLADAWKEDNDVNAVLGALLHLFGEDFMPCLPLAQLAAVSI